MKFLKVTIAFTIYIINSNIHEHEMSIFPEVEYCMKRKSSRLLNFSWVKSKLLRRHLRIVLLLPKPHHAQWKTLSKSQ